MSFIVERGGVDKEWGGGDGAHKRANGVEVATVEHHRLREHGALVARPVDGQRRELTEVLGSHTQIVLVPEQQPERLHMHCRLHARAQPMYEYEYACT